MPTDIIIWSATAHCWRTVRRPDPHGPIRFEPIADTMSGELARRAVVSAMRFAAPEARYSNGPAIWQAPASDWDD